MSGPRDDGGELETTSVRLPRSTRRRLKKMAAELGTVEATLIRRAIEDGMKSWAQPDVGEEAMTMLRFVFQRVVGIQATLNLVHRDRMTGSFFDELREMKALVESEGRKAL